MYTPKRTAEFEARVRAAAVAQMGAFPPLEGAIEVHLTIKITPPPSWSKAKRVAALGQSWHAVKPDADNVAKAVLDAMNGVVFADDSQVALLRVVKHYAEKDVIHVFVGRL